MHRNILILAIVILTSSVMMGQQRVPLYDEWFHAATCQLHREMVGDSLVYCLAVTLDEGDISVPRGSRLQVRLRGNVNIELTSARTVGKHDTEFRRYTDHTDRYITCHYHITDDQLLQLHEHELMRFRIETAQGWIERRAMRHLKLQ